MMSSEMPPIEILVVYYSRFGLVKCMAELIAEGARRISNATVRFLEVDDRPVEELRLDETESQMAMRRGITVNQLISADALIVGAPTYFGGMASAVKRLFEDCVAATPPPMDRTRPWLHHRFYDKVGAAFTASGTPHGGNEMALHSILTMMMHLGMVVVTPGQGRPILENPAAPYGATAIAGPTGHRPLNPEDEHAARTLGERVALLTTWLVTGRSSWNELKDLGRLPKTRT
jgi:NAD(P)H dehydrogenase (quinone)